MLRVHLTAEDLLRTRFASQPAPLIDLGTRWSRWRDPPRCSNRGATGPRRGRTGLLGRTRAEVLRAVLAVRDREAVRHLATPLGGRLVETCSSPAPELTERGA